MAEQDRVDVALQDADRAQSIEDGMADMLFGSAAEEAIEESKDEEEYEPKENVQVEGDDEEPEETEEDEEGEEKSEDEEASTVEVEYDGKLYEVPTELKDALLRQQDYTTKTQEVSAQRKEAEVLYGQLEQQRQAFEFAESIREDVMKAEQLEQQAQQYKAYLRDHVEELSSTEIERLRLAIEDAHSERDKIGKEVQGKQQEYQQAQQQSIQELLKKGTEVLRSKIPQWGESHQKAVREYALDLGFSEHEIQSVVDPRQVEVLWKASQYDSLQKGKGAAVKKVQKAPVIKPKARDPETGRFTKANKLKKALKSNSLSAADKASLIGEDIAGRFFNQ